jgi:RNA polymerase sigma-70 factor (ECF subfamily)
MPETSDDDLMRAAGCGDRAAFARLVARHLRRAGAVAARITGNRGDAEEIVQEAFLRAWLKAPSWQAQGEREAGAAFGTWLGRVVVNLCLDRKRRAAPLPLEAADAVADPAPDGFAAAAQGEEGRRVAAAVAALPERQRAALVLCHYEGFTNIEAAAMLEISVGALESLLVRARRTLRDSLADLAPHGSRA